MTKTQAVLGLCKRKIEFCAICNLKFNITNPRDIEFHKKLHNKMKIPKAIQLSKNFYRKKSCFFYGSKYVESCCTGTVSGSSYNITELTYSNETSYLCMITNLNKIFKTLKFDLNMG